MKILLYDLETSPNLAYVWGKYEQDVIRFDQEWYILSFAYKWLDEPKTRVVALPDFPEYKLNPTNDYGVVKKLHELFDEADITIAHNGDKFDRAKANARFIFHGLTPPSPYKTIDTLKIAHRQFAFNSNKLGDLGEYLKLGKKVDTGGFDLWLGCIRGDKKSWALMKKYNAQDVILLEQVYLKFRAWMPSHPHIDPEHSLKCPRCGLYSLRPKGWRYNTTTKVRRFVCSSCGGYCRAPQSVQIDKPFVSI